jgi:putative methyltransferase (TIGR04325 family)
VINRNSDKFVSGFKNVLSRSLPPMMTSLIRQITAPKARRYKSFQEALADCQNLGYADSDIASQVVNRTTKLVSEEFKNHKLSESDMRIILMGLRASQDRRIRVLDFGGGAGYHYFLFKSWCHPTTKVDWLVIETPTMVELSHGMRNSELNFVSEIPTKTEDSFDLVVVASSLQYTSDPIAILYKLINLNPEFFCITRTPMLFDDEEIITVQTSLLHSHGPGNFEQVIQNKKVQTPITFLPKLKLIEALEYKYGSFQINQDAKSSFQFKGKEIPAFGIICRLLH